MNLEKTSSHQFFELLPAKRDSGKPAVVISKRRALLGGAEHCDITIESPYISAIHAVIDIAGTECRVYDMNSTNGTFVNGTKIIAQKLNIGDELQVGDKFFKFKAYDESEVLPPVLDMLESLPQEDKVPVLPKAPPKIENVTPEAPVPQVAYPLSQDPKAEYLEYIFEDAENLYPIFDYSLQYDAVEVIVLYQERIFSVDYLPLKDAVYYMKGYHASKNEVEFPQIARDQKVPFLEVKGGEAYVDSLDSYHTLVLSDQCLQGDVQKYLLKDDDIIKFHQGEVEVYIRKTSAPPKVSTAPVIRRDSNLKKYLFLVLLFLIPLGSLMTFFEVDKELEKEKAPERIATILYKKRVIRKKIAKKQVVKPVKKIEVSKPKKEVVKKKMVAVKPKPTQSQPKKAIAPAVPKKVTQVTAKKHGGKAKTATRSRSRAYKTNTPTKGHVDTYKAIDFSSTMSSLLAKGGNRAKSGAIGKTSYDVGDTSLSTGGRKGKIQRAKVAHKIGSLEGVARGTLDSSRGVEGLVSKRGVYTVGIPSETVVMGSMDPDIIKRLLMDHINQFRHCYQKELDRSKQAFDGIITLNFVIGASGHVTRAGVSSGTSIKTPVRKCVVNVLRGIRFPEPLGGGVVEVKQPMNFYAQRK